MLNIKLQIADMRCLNFPNAEVGPEPSSPAKLCISLETMRSANSPSMLMAVNKRSVMLLNVWLVSLGQKINPHRLRKCDFYQRVSFHGNEYNEKFLHM